MPVKGTRRIEYTRAEEDAFIEAYIANGYVATKAYEAVFDCSNLSHSKVKDRARYLRKRLEPRITARRDELIAELYIDAKHVTQELASIGFAPSEEKMTYQHKLKALELLAKSMGMFDKDKTEKQQEIKITLTE